MFKSHVLKLIFGYIILFLEIMIHDLLIKGLFLRQLICIDLTNYEDEV